MIPEHQYPNRRHSDGIVIALNQRFIDFVERYDRDVGALNEWRETIDKKLEDQEIILRDINPVYKRGIWIAGLIILGSIGIAVKSFWAHLTWN